MRRAGPVVVLAAWVAACGGPELRIEDSHQFRFPDSLAAEIRVLSDSDITAVARWRVDSAPMLRIGADSGRGAFGHLAHAVRLADGRYLAADAARQHLIAFDRNGRLLGTWGRPGEGPGEFGYPAWVGRCRGLVYAYDGQARAVHVFAPDSTYRRTLRPTVASGGVAYELHPTRPLGCNRSGLIAGIASEATVWSQNGAGEIRAGPYRPVDVVGAGDPMSRIDALTAFPGEDRYRYKTGTGPLHVFGRRPSTALSNDHLFLATGDEYEIAAYGFAAKTWSLIRVDRPRVPITPAEIMAVKEKEVANPRLDNGSRARLKATMDEMTWPAFHPMIRALLVDAQSCLWVLEGRSTAPNARWSVFSPDGTPRGTVDLPPGFSLLQADADVLVGRERANRVDHLVVYRYSRTGGTC